MKSLILRSSSLFLFGALLASGCSGDHAQPPEQSAHPTQDASVSPAIDPLSAHADPVRGRLEFVGGGITTQSVFGSRQSIAAVDVRNISDRAVYLCLYEYGQEIAPSLLSRRRKDPACREPHHLGVETKFPDDSEWLREDGGYRWVPEQKRTGDRLSRTPPEAIIGPGETRRFVSPVHKQLLPTEQHRAVLLDHALGRIDRILLEAQQRLGGTSLIGVNLAGGEFGSVPGIYNEDYTYPGVEQFDYCKRKGLWVVRLPIRWERVQPKEMEPLDPTELARLDEIVELARERDIKLMFDLHNYARYKGKVIGKEAPIEAFADFWRRFARHYQDEPAIFAFGLMNEPHDTAGQWPAAAQAGIDAIREVDRKHTISVCGDEWSGAHSWKKHNNDLVLNDPENNLMYEAHQYFDGDCSGKYRQSYDASGAYPEIGVDRLRPFIDWLKEHNARGFIGEFGAPDNDPRWLVVLDKFLAAMKENQIGGTYWAAGPRWGNYPLSVEPRNGEERPQMAILQQYVEGESPISKQGEEGVLARKTEPSPDDLKTDGPPGQIVVRVMNHKAMQIVLPRKSMYGSNALNRQVRIDEKGKTLVLIGTKPDGEKEWVEYDHSDPSYVPPNDVEVELYRVESTSAAKCCDSRGILHTGGAVVTGDTFTFSNLRPGRYRVVGVTEVQKQEIDTVPLQAAQPGSPSRTFLQAAKDTGYWQGKIGKDERGPYEVIAIEETQGWNARIYKRYNYICAEQVETLVLPDERDRVLLMVCDDPDLAEKLWRAGGVPQTPGVGSDPVIGNATRIGRDVLLEKIVINKMFQSAFGRNAIATLVSTSLDHERDLFSKEFFVDAGIDLALAQLVQSGIVAGKVGSKGGFHVAVVVLAAKTTADLTVAQAQKDFVQSRSDTDDLLVKKLTYYESTGELVVALAHYGRPLSDLRIRESKHDPLVGISPAREQGTSIAEMKSGQRGELSYFLGNQKDLANQSLELAYDISPYPGYRFTYTRPLGWGQVEVVRSPDATGSNTLQIVSAMSEPGRAYMSIRMQSVMVRVKNAGAESVRLYIRNRDGKRMTAVELRDHKRDDSAFCLTYGLGIEARYGQNRNWQPPISDRTWVVVDKQKNPMDEEFEIDVLPGQTRSLGISMPTADEVNGAKSFRVFAVDPHLRRIDERVVLSRTSNK